MARMRIIAGPNGSGKTYLTKWLRNNQAFKFGHYINADEIEAGLRRGESLSFADFGLNAILQDQLQQFYDVHVLKEKSPAAFEIRENRLYMDEPLLEQTYFGTLLSDFIRTKLIETGLSFTFETVMSGSDKLRLLQQAIDAGYRIYLYFICTEDPIINIERIADRVLKKGHHVPDSLVTARYEKTLKNLPAAAAMSYRTFMFDNSGLGQKLVCEVFEGKELKLNTDFLPAWFKKYYLSLL